jgi:hypothetical protein
LSGLKLRLGIVASLSFIVFVFVFFCPYPFTNAPGWKFVVVAQNAEPVAGIHVRREWQVFDDDDAPRGDTRSTDGGASFPGAVTRLSLPSRAGMGQVRDVYQ